VVNPSESTPGVNQSVVHKNVTANSKPTAKRNPDKLTRSVSGANPSRKLAAKRKAPALVLRLSINDEPLSAEPSVFNAYLMAFVCGVPDFHFIERVMPANDKSSATPDQ
jgi:hypothetical protein